MARRLADVFFSFSYFEQYDGIQWILCKQKFLNRIGPNKSELIVVMRVLDNFV